MPQLLLWTVAAALSFIAVVVVWGYLLPRGHVASGTAIIRAEREVVWILVTDVKRRSEWRKGIKRVEVLCADAGKPIWREIDLHERAVTYRTLRSEPPGSVTWEIADRNLPFGGWWTIVLAEHSAGTKMTITERGEIRNPAFRFVSRFVIGHTATLNRFLTDLQKALLTG